MARDGWSVEGFAQYWSEPVPHEFANGVTDDVVGHWPGDIAPVRGRAAYAARIADMLELLPGMRLVVAEHASADDITFIRWVLHAEGRHGPFTMTGVDRVRLEGGRVAENYIVFDTWEFTYRSGHTLPWTGQ